MFNPQEYLRVVEEFKTKEMVEKCAISLIEKEMLEFARAPRLPWVEIFVPAKMGEVLREKVSQKYINGGWSLVASTQEDQETRFVFCTKEMMKDWFNFREKIGYDDTVWNVVCRKEDVNG